MHDENENIRFIMRNSDSSSFLCCVVFLTCGDSGMLEYAKGD